MERHHLHAYRVSPIWCTSKPRPRNAPSACQHANSAATQTIAPNALNINTSKTTSNVSPPVAPTNSKTTPLLSPNAPTVLINALPVSAIPTPIANLVWSDRP